MTTLIKGFALTYKIWLQTSLQIRTGYGYQHLDHTIVRDQNGNPRIPSSSLKGRLRHHARQLDALLTGHEGGGTQSSPDSALIQQLFGSRLNQGHLFFEDGIFQLNPPPSASRVSNQEEASKNKKHFPEERAGIQINRFLGSVRKKHLHMDETAPASLSFESSVDCKFRQAQPLEQSEALFYLLGSMQLCSKLGGGKSRGQGKVLLKPVGLSIVDEQEQKQMFQEKSLKEMLEKYMNSKLEGSHG
ncbi:RAMP superfamily CRISPR-associated protein [Deltaproteobacteria bacterium TL4]